MTLLWQHQHTVRAASLLHQQAVPYIPGFASLSVILDELLLCVSYLYATRVTVSSEKSFQIMKPFGPKLDYYR